MISKYIDTEIEEKCRDINFFNEFKSYLPERSQLIVSHRLGLNGRALTYKSIGLLVKNQSGSKPDKIKNNDRPICANRAAGIYRKSLRIIRRHFDLKAKEEYKNG